MLESPYWGDTVSGDMAIFSRDDIDRYLTEVKSAIGEGFWSVARNDNRQDNVSFIREFNLTHNKIKGMMLRLTADDFCEAVKNVKAGYESETLYVFCMKEVLYSVEDSEEMVDIYVKLNFLRYAAKRRVIVVSLHRARYPMECAFKTVTERSGSE
jgi:hypothetical protein